MLGTGDKENLLSELTVHREAKKSHMLSLRVLTHKSTGCLGALVRREKRNTGKASDTSDLKSALKVTLGRPFARTRGPWGFRAAGTAQHSLKMCAGPGTLGQLKTKLEEQAETQRTKSSACLTEGVHLGATEASGDRKGGREGLDVVA